MAARKRTRELADLANTKNLNGTLIAETDLDGAADGGGGQVGRQLAMSRDELLTTTKVGLALTLTPSLTLPLTPTLILTSPRPRWACEARRGGAGRTPSKRWSTA